MTGLINERNGKGIWEKGQKVIKMQKQHRKENKIVRN
jgi:hypothetical protein